MGRLQAAFRKRLAKAETGEWAAKRPHPNDPSRFPGKRPKPKAGGDYSFHPGKPPARPQPKAGVGNLPPSGFPHRDYAHKAVRKAVQAVRKHKDSQGFTAHHKRQYGGHAPPKREQELARRVTRLSVPEKHALRIARDTLRMPDAMVGVMGGPDKKQAKEIIRRLLGR